MADIKTSSNEEEYFHKLEQERLARRKEESGKAKTVTEREALQKLHYMHCPKDGSTLMTETYHGIQIERCPECKGVWFDTGEAESLLDKEPGAMGKLFGDMFGGLGGSGKKKK